MESHSFEEVSGNSVYSKIISEIKYAVIGDDLDRFKILTALLNFVNIHKSCEEVNNYRQTAYGTTGNCNFITLACKSCAVNILRHLLSDDNCIYNVPFPVDKSVLLPKEDDEHHHNAFYYAIRSNNCNLLEILIDKWPNDCFKKNSDKLDDVLSEAYKDLSTRNVYICKSMEIFVKTKLVDLRFFNESVFQKSSAANRHDTQSLKDLTVLRIDYVLWSISYVRDQFWDSDPNEMFTLSVEYIVKNIHTLKAVIKSTHKLPWEEMEFCLVIFIRSCRCRFQKYPLYNFLLNKQTVLMHLGNFSEVLIAVKKQIKSGKVNKFQRIVIKGLEGLETKPEFQALVHDFTQARDLYTLETIRKSTTITASADVSDKNGQYLITRALQIIGEHLKNTLDSPNLSNATYELLLSAMTDNIKEIISDLRNCLSHAESFSSRFENEENVISFFASIQSDVVQLSTKIFEVLYSKKAAAFGMLLNKMNDCENASSIRLFLKENHFSSSAFQREIAEIEETQDLHIIGYIEELERLVQKFELEVYKGLNSSKELFRRIHDVADESHFQNDTYKGLNSSEELCRRNHDVTDECHFQEEIYEGLSSSKEPFRQIFAKNHDLPNSIDHQESTLEDDIEKAIKIYGDSSSGTNLPSFGFECEALSQQFMKMRMDSGKLREVLNRILVMRQIKATKSVITKIRSYGNSSDVEELMTRIQELEEENPVNEVKGKESENFILGACMFFDIVLNDAKEIFQKIYQIIKEEKARLEKIRLHFHKALQEFITIVKLVPDDEGPDHFKLFLKAHVSVIRNTVCALPPSNTETFSDTLSLAFKDLAQLLDGSRLQGDGFKDALFDLYNFIEFRMGQIKGIKEFKHMLKSIKKNKRSKLPHDKSKINNFDQLSRTLSSLKTVISNHGLEILTTEKIQNCEENSTLQYLIEMFLLDVMSALECFPDRLAHNAYFLDTDFPVVNGKNLRNHLAHGNVLVGELLQGEFINALLNAKKLIEAGNLLQTDRQIGKKVNNDPVKLKASHDGDLTSIHQQQKLFFALTEGDMGKVQKYIARGADLYGRDLNSLTSLHLAAKGPNPEMVKFLLELNIDVNVQDDEGQTALHIAAANGRLFTVQFLLQDMKMKTDCRDNSQKTPLHIACENGHLDVVNYLLQRSAETFSNDLFGFSPLHYAIKGNFIDIVRLLLESESNIDVYRFMAGYSALHLAAETGNLDLVSFLIEKNADVNCRSNKHFVPLHLAACKGHVGTVQLLIANGADVNSRNVFMDTPLHMAVKKGHTKTVEVLLNHGANLSAINLNKVTPLGLAAEYGYLSIAKLLLQKVTVLDTLKDCGVKHSLKLAARAGYYEIIQILINKSDSIAKTSALVDATVGGHSRIVELFVTEGVSINTKWDSSDLNILHIASLLGHTDIVEFLITQGCDVNTKAGGSDPENLLNYEDQRYSDELVLETYNRSKRRAGNGQTALHLSASSGHRDTVRCLLRNKANIYITNDFGETGLPAMIENGMANVVIEENVAVGLIDCGNNKPLHLGCIEGDLKFVKYCIKVGCDIESRTQQFGYTALHLAVKNDHAEVVNYLLDNGSNINAKTNNGFTAVSIAVEENKKNILNILMSRNAELTAKKERMFLIKAVKKGNEDIVGYLLYLNRSCKSHVRPLPSSYSSSVWPLKYHKNVIRGIG